MSDEKKIFLCDIDGTLANNSHRQHFVRIKPKNFGAFNRGMGRDLPIPQVIEVLKCLHASGHEIVLVSGRGEETRQVTEEWLKRYDVPYHALYMRAEGDYRKDSVIKSELLDKIIDDYGTTPFAAIDDRNQVRDECWFPRGVFLFHVNQTTEDF